MRLRRRLLEMMPFVDHEALVRRQHGGVIPVLRRAAHGDIGEQQMMIHDDHVGHAPPCAALNRKHLS